MDVTEPDRTVPSGAIATAVLMVEALGSRDVDGAEPAEYQADMLTAVRHWGRDTIVAALGTLIGAGLGTLAPAPGEPDQLHGLVPAAVERFRRMQLPEVPDDALPTVAGVVTAAVLGQDPYRWRLSLGPLGPREHMLWAYVAWAVAELVDDVHGAPGTFAGIVSEAIRHESGEEPDAAAAHTKPAP